MREVVFRVVAERPGHLEAQAESMPIRITAPTRCGCAATPVPPSAASGRWDALRRSVVDPGGPSPRPRPAPPRSPARSCWPLTIPPPWSGSTGLCWMWSRGRASAACTGGFRGPQGGGWSSTPRPGVGPSRGNRGD